MPRPSSDDQVRFLLNVQRLLSEGAFVATYEYALLLALADIAVESGADSGEELEIHTRQISEKFIEYYWRQAVPYVPRQGRAGLVLNGYSRSRRGGEYVFAASGLESGPPRPAYTLYRLVQNIGWLRGWSSDHLPATDVEQCE